MDNLQMLTQTWSGPLVVALQILLILLVAWSAWACPPKCCGPR